MDIISDLHELDDLYRGLGRMIIKFQDLEKALHFLICSLSDTPDINKSIACSALLNFSQLVEAIEKLVDLNDSSEPHKLETIKRMLGRIRSAGATRNKLVHSVWELAPSDTGHFSRLKLRGQDPANVHPDEISTFIVELNFIFHVVVSCYRDPIIDAILGRLETKSDNGGGV